MVKLFVCLCLFGGFPRKLCVILSEKKELKYLIIIIIDAALCVLISSHLFYTICAGRMSSSWRSCCSFQFGHVRPLSTLRLLWQTRCGCIDHWCHSVP